MRSNRQPSHEEVKRFHPRFRWDLYYHERIGTEYYLRITPFAIILVVIVLAIGFTILFLDGSSSQRKIDVNITTLPTPPASPAKSAITPTPAPIKPPPGKRSK